MALTATVFSISIQLSDVDRAVYETLDLKVAQHPSETAEYMASRVLAYCLEYQEGIELTQGVSTGDEPAVLVRDLTGKITAWIEVGMPDAERLHRASKLAARVAVYTHRDLRQLLLLLNGKKIHRAEEIPIVAFEKSFLEAFSQKIERRTSMSLTITERHVYLDLGGVSLSTVLEEHRL